MVVSVFLASSTIGFFVSISWKTGASALGASALRGSFSLLAVPKSSFFAGESLIFRDSMPVAAYVQHELAIDSRHEQRSRLAMTYSL